MSYRKNKRRNLILVILLFVFTAGIIFSASFRTVQAETDMFQSLPPGVPQPGIVEILTGAWRLAVMAPFLPIYAFITGILIPAANSLFIWAIKVDNFRAVVASPEIYNIWKIVRDFLNIGFILVLLFSAFATIFQVEKYSYKKILLHLVLMALLVNFSFPIARFIIDLSNVLMYTLINMLFQGGQNGISKALAMMADKAGISAIMAPNGSTASSTAAILAAIIFGFIFAITMLAVAIMLVIRIIMLAILIIFSPVAFVASIIPGTASYAHSWWSHLFKYAFFGPIMVFMLYVAVMTMQYFSSVKYSFNVVATSEAVDPSFVGTIAYLAIPIVILWIGLGVAQSMSIAGAGAVMGGAQKIIKKTGGASWWATKKIVGSTGVPGGIKQTWDYWGKKGFPGRLKNIPGFRGTERTEELESGIASVLTGDKRLKEEVNAKRIKDAEDKNNTKDMTDKGLDGLENSANVFDRAAATIEKASRGTADDKGLAKIRNDFGEDSQAVKRLENKIKTYDPSTAFKDMRGKLDLDKLSSFLKSNQFDANKLNANALKSPELMKMMFENQLISGEDIEKQRKKSKTHADNIKTSLDAIIGGATDSTDETHQNMQKAYLQQHGKLSTGAATGATSAAWQEEIFKTGDKETFKRMSDTEVATHAPAMAMHINSGRFKNIVESMQNNEAKSALVQYVRGQHNDIGPVHKNVSRLGDIAKRDWYLRNL